MRVGLLAATLWLAACSQAAPQNAPAFVLRCESLDTPSESTLQCVRVDTRDGDVRVVDLDEVPITSGTSRSLAEAAGTYQLECDATTTSQRSDLFCVRLHTQTGEVVLLKLSELPRWPSTP